MSRDMIDSVERYIAYNALKWWLRNGGGRALMALHEPLKSPRLGQSEYWRGNSPEEISRAACLDYNARIIDIADKSAYALPGELRWLK